MKNQKPTMTDVRRVVSKHGGRVVADGMGGYEVLAPPERRWIDAEVQCYVLPLSEYRPEERANEIESCIRMIKAGHEPYPS